MYVLLRGQVAVYYDYGSEGSDSSELADTTDVDVVETKTGNGNDDLRQQLRTFVVSLNRMSPHILGRVTIASDSR